MAFVQLEVIPSGKVGNSHPGKCPYQVTTAVQVFGPGQYDGSKADYCYNCLYDFLKGLHVFLILSGTGYGAFVLCPVVVNRESSTVFGTQTGCIVSDQGRLAVVGTDNKLSTDFQKKESTA